jgi:shikimate dehydrogenase
MFPDAHTRLLTLLGDPVGHSWSPLIHNTALRHAGLNLLYAASRVRPADLPAAVAGLRALRFAGANVTIPHKEAVLPLLDTWSREAAAIGAVNTIVCQAGGDDEVRLHGDNTDVAGFIAPLQPMADRLRGAEMLVWGAGGAARAVVYALLMAFQPGGLTLCARNTGRAERLLEDLGTFDTRQALRLVTPDAAAPAVCHSTLLVNATPLGMHPQIEDTPWSEAAHFGPHQVVYDLVYQPRTTRLLQAAAHRGAMTCGGLEMLLGQAAAAFVQWTGQPMPLDPVRKALERQA